MSSFLRGIIASYGHTAATLLVTLVTTPLYLHWLGPELYGLWLTAYSILSYLSLSGLGLPNATQLRLTQAVADARHSDAATTLTTAVVLTAALGVVTAAGLSVAVWLGWLSSSGLLASQSARTVALPLLAILGGGYLIGLPLEHFRGALRAMQRVDVEQAVGLIGRLTSPVMALVVFAAGGNILGLATSQSILTLATGLAFAALALPRLSARREHFHYDAAIARTLLAPSVHFVLIALSGALIWNTDNLVLAAGVGPAAVTPYAVSMRLLSVASGIVAVGFGAMGPRVTQLWVSGELDGLRSLVLRIVRLVNGVVALVGVQFLFAGRQFIALWAGTAAMPSRTVFIILVAIFAIRTVTASFEMVVVGSGRHHGYAYVAVLQGLVHLALATWWVRSDGATGVAAANLGAHLLGTAWFLPWRGASLVGLSLGSLALRTVLPLLAPAIAAVGIHLALASLSLATTWCSWFLVCGLSTALFLVVLLRWSLSKDDRLFLRGLLPKSIA